MQCGECPTNMASITRPFILEAFSGSAHSIYSATNTVGADDPNMETPFDAVKAEKIVVDASKPTAKRQVVCVECFYNFKLSKITGFEHVILQHAIHSDSGFGE